MSPARWVLAPESDQEATARTWSYDSKKGVKFNSSQRIGGVGQLPCHLAAARQVPRLAEQ
jgi:hypothetical protein